MIEIINGAQVITSLKNDNATIKSIVITHSENEYTKVHYITKLLQNTVKLEFVETIQHDLFDVHIFKVSENITEETIKKHVEFIKFVHHNCELSKKIPETNLNMESIHSILLQHCDISDPISHIYKKINNNNCINIACGIIDFEEFVEKMRNCGIRVSENENIQEHGVKLKASLISNECFQKLYAVRTLKDSFKLGLKESKDIVDEFENGTAHIFTVTIPKDVKNTSQYINSFVDEMKKHGVLIEW